MKYLLIIKILLEKIIKLNICFLKREISGYPKLVKEFENNFSNYIGKKFGLTFCNGTSSIEAALYALNLSKDDEVLVPSSTFHATLGPIINLSLKPVFVDIDPHTLTVDCNDIRKKITSRCKALLIVHPWGYPCNMNEIQKISREFKLKLIEDCSHAHGATFDGKKVGSFGDIGCFSLQGAKAIAAGEGGITVTDNYDYYLRMSSYGHFNRNEKEFLSKDDFKIFAKTGLSKKLRAHPLGISIASADLDNLVNLNKFKNKIYNKIDKIISKYDSISTMQLNKQAIRGGFFGGYPIIFENINQIAEIKKKFNKYNIDIYPYQWLNHHKMKVFGTDEIGLPVTESILNKFYLINIPYFLNFNFKKLEDCLMECKKSNLI